MNIKKNIDNILMKISAAAESCNRNLSEIKLVSVTKTVDVETMKILIENHIVDFGENKQQVMLPKYDELRHEKLRWHFIGNLQTNKIRSLADKVYMYHSIVKSSQLEELQKRCVQTARVLIEVNTSGEMSKQGISEEEAKRLAECAMKMDNIELCGLMTMAPFVNDENIIRSSFEKLRVLRDEFCCEFGDGIRELSMGMSNDYEYAIREGATILRIGSAFFV